MSKKRNIFIAALFAVAIGSAFTTSANSAKFLGNWQKTASGCPSTSLICPFTSGTPCANIFLDNACAVQAYRH